MSKEIKTTYQYSDYRGSEMIWSTEDIESIAENLDINYLDFDDYERILNDTFKNYGTEIMDELRAYFEAQTYTHAKAKKKRSDDYEIILNDTFKNYGAEIIKEKEYYLKRGNTSGTID